MVDVTNLAHGENPAIMPVTGLHSLPVNPAGSVRVPLDLVVLLERLGAYRTTLVQELLNLTQHQRVAFQRGGVVRLLMPDIGQID